MLFPSKLVFFAISNLPQFASVVDTGNISEKDTERTKEKEKDERFKWEREVKGGRETINVDKYEKTSSHRT